MLKSMGKKEFRWTDEEVELLSTETHQYKVHSIGSLDNLMVQSTDTKYFIRGLKYLISLTLRWPSSMEDHMTLY